MLLSTLVSISNQVAATSGRLAKIKLLADLLKQASPDEIELVISTITSARRFSSRTIEESRASC